MDPKHPRQFSIEIKGVKERLFRFRVASDYLADIWKTYLEFNILKSEGHRLNKPFPQGLLARKPWKFDNISE